MMTQWARIPKKFNNYYSMHSIDDLYASKLFWALLPISNIQLGDSPAILGHFRYLLAMYHTVFLGQLHCLCCSKILIYDSNFLVQCETVISICLLNICTILFHHCTGWTEKFVSLFSALASGQLDCKFLFTTYASLLLCLIVGIFDNNLARQQFFINSLSFLYFEADWISMTWENILKLLIPSGPLP